MAQMQLSYRIDFIPGYSRGGKIIRKFLPAGSSSHRCAFESEGPKAGNRDYRGVVIWPVYEGKNNDSVAGIPCVNFLDDLETAP